MAKEFTGERGAMAGEMSAKEDVYGRRGHQREESDGRRGRRGRKKTRARRDAGEGGSECRRRRRGSAKFRKINRTHRHPVLLLCSFVVNIMIFMI